MEQNISNSTAISSSSGVTYFKCPNCSNTFFVVRHINKHLTYMED